MKNKDFELSGGVLYAYNGQNEVVKIPSYVQKIATGAFCGALTVRRVEINEGVSEIEESSFSDCPQLQEIALPVTLEKFWRPVQNCYRFQRYEIASDNAIYSCLDGCILDKQQGTLFSVPMGLEGKFEIPSSVKTIGDYAFSGCGKISEVAFPEELTQIGKAAFKECRSLGRVNLPCGVVTLKEDTFSYCSRMTYIALHQRLIEIGDSTFYFCRKLTDLVLPERLEKIGKNAFYGCVSLGKVKLPSCLNSLEESAFESCKNLVIEK